MKTREKTNRCFKRLKRQRKNKTKQIRAHDYQNKLLIPKEREISKNIYNKRLDKIEELDKKIDYGDLIFITERKNRKTDFSQKKRSCRFY